MENQPTGYSGKAIDLDTVLQLAIRAAEEASRDILEVYHSGDFQTEQKDDRSPLTLADKKAHRRIIDVLQPSGLPVLSEEGKDIPYQERRHWEYFWLVDPLDGTKEFIKRNGEFTVNIALIQKDVPVLGVVAVPATGELFFASDGRGAWMRTHSREVPLMKRSPVDLNRPGLRVVASRSHMNEETRSFIERLSDPVLVSKGSSLKFMLIATGQADIYPRFAPTMEWDTAAAHAIVKTAGYKVLQAETESEIVYNKENLLNPPFLVF